MTKLSEQRRPLWERCGGRCEVSGRPLDFETFDMHHRRNKGMGGTSREDVDELWNLLALDPVVHNGGPQSVHGRRSWSEERGYLVPKNVNEVVLWPVYLYGLVPARVQRWVLLSGVPRYYDPPPGSVSSFQAGARLPDHQV
jgi:hypothetical protein